MARPYLLLVVICAAVLGACSRQEGQAGPASPAVAPEPALAEIPGPNPVAVHYRCDNNAEVVAQYGKAGALLELPPEQQLKLKRAVSASGEKFGEEPPTWWIKGAEATLILPGDRQVQCEELTAAQ